MINKTIINYPNTGCEMNRETNNWVHFHNKSISSLLFYYGIALFDKCIRDKGNVEIWNSKLFGFKIFQKFEVLIQVECTKYDFKKFRVWSKHNYLLNNCFRISGWLDMIFENILKMWYKSTKIDERIALKQTINLI